MISLRHRNRARLLVLLALFTAGSPVAAQLFSRGNTRLESPDDSKDFGTVMIRGDFNGDFRSDLAAGAQETSIAGFAGAGEVLVWLASPLTGGLVDPPARFAQGLDGLPGTPAANEAFGAALATGDFNGDGYDDLAVEVRGEDVAVDAGTAIDAGAVEVIYGSASGLTTAGAQIFDQESAGIADVAQTDDHFGRALVAADFDFDSFDDLAIGGRDKDVGSLVDAGAVWILHGSASGLSGVGSEFFDEAAAGGTLTTGNRFGEVLAATDFNHDGKADLVVGVPQESVNGHAAAGAVWILSGGFPTMTLPGFRLVQGGALAPGTLPGSADAGDLFGSSLAIGDFNVPIEGSAYIPDLAVGAVGENDHAGAVTFVAGGPFGLTSTGAVQFMAADLGTPGTALFFGFALASGTLHSRFRDDLIVGSILDPVSGQPGAGRTYIIRGTASGLDLASARAWSAAFAGSACGPAVEDGNFGYSLASGNFARFGYTDLAIGVPGFAPAESGPPAGAIQLLFSALFAADFETADLAQWSTSAP
ncbi:MAG: FG-GAP repeat protein [Thermoanaerobaculia bacterium]